MTNSTVEPLSKDTADLCRRAVLACCVFFFASHINQTVKIYLSCTRAKSGVYYSLHVAAPSPHTYSVARLIVCWQGTFFIGASKVYFSILDVPRYSFTLIMNVYC